MSGPELRYRRIRIELGTSAVVFNQDMGDIFHKEIFFYSEAGATVTSAEVSLSMDGDTWDDTCGIGEVTYRVGEDLTAISGGETWEVLLEDSLARYIKITMAGTGFIQIFPRITYQ